MKHQLRAGRQSAFVGSMAALLVASVAAASPAIPDEGTALDPAAPVPALEAPAAPVGPAPLTLVIAPEAAQVAALLAESPTAQEPSIVADPQAVIVTKPAPSRRAVRAVLAAARADLDVPAAIAYSPASMDLTGRMPSLYTGEYFDPSREQYRLCVSKRESTHTGSVRGGGGDRYTGFYQFSPELARGATWMMMDEARKVGLGDDVEALRDVAMNKWPRYFQDWAFWRVLNHGDGARHWAGGRWYCNSAPGAESGW